MSEILTEQDKQAILKAIKDLQALKVELARAKRAGIDVSVQEARVKELETQLENLRKVYVSPTPTTP